MKKLITSIILSATLLSPLTIAQAQGLKDLPVPVGPINEMTYSPTVTRLSLWSPVAEEVCAHLYNKDLGGEAIETVALKRAEDGTWSVILNGDRNGLFYTFQVKVNGKWLEETPGIFAKTVGTNGQRAMIMDLQTTDPAGWSTDKTPELKGLSDVVLYEMHHRDFSVDASSGIKNKGKFLALTEKGTRNPAGLATGTDHLKELGVTHVHLLPSYDYGSIDERTGKSVGGGGRDQVTYYNWGYDPVNYNCPEGSYSTNPANPATRIKEFKEMVMAMHKAGLRVVMDVVYNHVFDLMQSNFQKTVPDYFFRWQNNSEAKSGQSAERVASNGSGCGNETASEMPMMRKYMVESVLYWMKEFHVDGFRFDLMGIHDIETMNAIREAAQAVDPNVIIYGEGWAASAPAYPEEKLAMKANTAQLGGIAAFGDEMRDGLRGGWRDDKEGAFLIGIAGNEESVKFGIVGAIQHPGIDYSKVNYSKAPWAEQPTQMISYVSCHDDMCIADRLKCTLSAKKGKKKLTDDQITKQQMALMKLAETVTLTSQGVPFIWCGDEIMRDRKGVHNCYASPDSVNAIDWNNKTAYLDIFNYIKDMIALRKAHPAFRMGCAEKVRNNLAFIPVKQKNVVAFTIKGSAVGDSWSDIVVVFNSNDRAVVIPVEQGKYTIAVENGKISEQGLRNATLKTIKVAPQSATIMYK